MRPPAATALATARVAEEVGEGPGSLLEVGSGGIHAPVLALLGWTVTVAESSPGALARARERAGGVATVVERERVVGLFDVVVAAGPDEGLRRLGRRLVVA